MIKKWPFYITLAIAVSVIAAFILHYISEHTPKKVAAPTTDDNTGTTGSEPAKQFSGFNYNLQLNRNTPNAEAEITLLQEFINAYYGAPQLAVNGVYDEATAAAVRDIAKQENISLFNFRYYYLVPAVGENTAIEIIRKYTVS